MQQCNKDVSDLIRAVHWIHPGTAVRPTGSGRAPEHRPAGPGGPDPTTRVAASVRVGVFGCFWFGRHGFSDFLIFIQSVDFLRLQVCQPFSSASFSRLLGRDIAQRCLRVFRTVASLLPGRPESLQGSETRHSNCSYTWHHWSTASGASQKNAFKL